MTGSQRPGVRHTDPRSPATPIPLSHGGQMVALLAAIHAGASWRAAAGAFALRHRHAAHATYRQASVSRLAKKM